MNESICSLPLWVSKCVLPLVYACPTDSSVYLAFVESLSWVLEGTPPGDFVVLLGDSNAHEGNDGETWNDVIGRNGLPHLSPSSVLLLDWTVQTGHGAHEYSVGDASGVWGVWPITMSHSVLI